MRGAFGPLREAAMNGADMGAQRRLLLDGMVAHRVPEDALLGADSRMEVGVALFELGDAWGTSRLAGTPQLPRGHAWPRDRAGEPLTFIASLDLAELAAPEPLPEAGILLVYWSEEGTRVFRVADGVPIADAEPPARTSTSRAVHLTGARMPLLTDTDGLPASLLEDLADELGPHQLLGAPRGINRAELPGEGWRFLAQLASGDRTLYLVTPEADLRTAQFDRTVGFMRQTPA
jgi:hypothetical protein